MKIEQIIKSLKSELQDLTNTVKTELSDLQEQLQKLSNENSSFDKNWLGEWASSTYDVYNNIISGSGKVRLGEKEIYDYLHKQTGIKLEDIKDKLPHILKKYRDFQNKVASDLSIIRGKENFEPEIELLNKIESQEWGILPWDYIKSIRPQRVFTQDLSILNKGLSTPPHLSVGSEIFSLFSMLTSIDAFETNAFRILRQLELKLSIEELPAHSNDFIPKLINSFHNVSKQLLNRHSQRETIKIADEYDVQDLMHSLLRIQFEDIRPEEYTPSYAGSSTRVDFLLKKEKIVIEIKKTRKGLADKEIGEQLILDAQHYKTHPDCKKLICFVYDPDNMIRNPRGLESDLNSLSSEDMIVEVYIRP